MNTATRLFYFGQEHPSLRGMVSKILRVLFSCDLGSLLGWGGVILLNTML